MSRPRSLRIIRIVDGVARPDTIEDSLEAMQAAVGGYVEAVQLTPELTLWIDEEGRLKDLPHNVSLGTMSGYIVDVVGPAFVARSTDDGENASVEPGDLAVVALAVQLAAAARLGLLERREARERN